MAQGGVHVRHEGRLWLTVTPDLCKGGNKAVAVAGLFDEERRVQVLDCDVDVLGAFKVTQRFELVKFLLEFQ